MAKIKFGMMMTDARGKLGGQVFSKNRSGAYVRTKVTPVNPRTTAQQENRSLLGTLSSAWSGLADIERNSWNSAVESWLKTNVFGDQVKPTGKNLFTGLNKNMLQAFPANAVMNVAPAKQELSTVFIIESTYSSTTTGLLNFTLNVSETTGKNFRVRATPPLSAGTSYYKNQLRTLGTSFVGVEGDTISVGNIYFLKYGEVPVNSSIFVEIAEVLANGQLGVPSVVQAKLL